MREQIGSGRMIGKILNHSANSGRDASEQHALAISLENFSEKQLRIELERLEIDSDRPTPI